MEYSSNGGRRTENEGRYLMTTEITMYGAQWCGDCRRAKRYLETNDIPYSWIDLEANPDEIATVMKYNGGRKSIPVVVFPDGSHLTEPSDAELDAKLGR
ncbi:MAG: mycoredoxin [Acidimicrobiia bacterium]|nr:MAG: mycoredoxin [Acidimicrobiia bacterium]